MCLKSPATSHFSLPRHDTAGGILYQFQIKALYLRWLVFGSSTYYLYAFVASILAALISSLIWNWYYICPDFRSMAQ
jgi:hypothetical protein